MYWVEEMFDMGQYTNGFNTQVVKCDNGVPKS